jgi:hypothetical protein
MRLIQDFTQLETDVLFKGLRSYKRTIIGWPIGFALIPTLGIVALRPSLWWLIPVYIGGILFVTSLVGTALSRSVVELEKRMKDSVEPAG